MPRWATASKLPPRPERTRISCYAALTSARVCGFQQGKPHEPRQRLQPRQEIRGSAVEGPSVSLSGSANVALYPLSCRLSFRPMRISLASSTVVFLAGSLALAQAPSSTQTSLSLMPVPSSITRGEGTFTVTAAGGGPSTFNYNYGQTHDARLEAAVRRDMVRLGRTCGGEVLRSTIDHPSPTQASLLINVAGPGEPVQTIDEDESYQLQVTGQGATLTAATDLGAMHGLERLLQLATMDHGACVLPAVTIKDVPRFRWRGFTLDVSRHFEPVGAVERTLDGMAAAKLNVFHWHLSDDQGFRAESKKFPKLTEVASEGEYYTQDQLREVVAYARARGIRVVPEFDMPGHGSSWIMAYPT